MKLIRSREIILLCVLRKVHFFSLKYVGVAISLKERLCNRDNSQWLP